MCDNFVTKTRIQERNEQHAYDEVKTENDVYFRPDVKTSVDLTGVFSKFNFPQFVTIKALR